MKKILTTFLVLAGVLFFGSFADAQYGSSLEEEENTTSGERVMQPGYGADLEEEQNFTLQDPTVDTSGGDPDQPLINGNVPNPEEPDKASPVLTEPSVGGKDGTTSPESATQHNESDMEFVRRLPSVAVSAVEVRGWDMEEKEAFLEAVKEHAEVRSGEDLENFARGVLLRDQDVEEIEIGEDSVVVKRDAPARFLGIFEAKIREEVKIVFGDGEYGRVKVKFPWYRFMYRVFHDTEGLEERIEGELVEEFGDDVEVNLPTMAASFLDALVGE